MLLVQLSLQASYCKHAIAVWWKELYCCVSLMQYHPDDLFALLQLLLVEAVA